MALHCTQPFIIILPLSRYDLNNVERDVKHQIILIIVTVLWFQGIAEHNNVTDPGGVHIEPDTAITPVDQRPKQNGTLHSRGNSADLT